MTDLVKRILESPVGTVLCVTPKELYDFKGHPWINYLMTKELSGALMGNGPYPVLGRLVEVDWGGVRETERSPR